MGQTPKLEGDPLAWPLQKAGDMNLIAQGWVEEIDRAQTRERLAELVGRLLGLCSLSDKGTWLDMAVVAEVDFPMTALLLRRADTRLRTLR